MSILIKINNYRRKLTRLLTKNIGKSNIKYKGIINKDEVINVLISRPNHRLGNQLLMTPLIQEITTTFPNCKIDLFVKGGLAPIIFENYPNIDTIIQLPKKPFKELGSYVKVWISLKKKKYDIVINVDKDSSSGRLSTRFVNSKFKLFGEEESDFNTKYSDYSHLAKNAVYDLRNLLSHLGIPNLENQMPLLDIKLSPAEIDKGRELLNQLVQNPQQKTIALFTFATGSKCYSEEWWMELYEKMKVKFADCNIIEILPMENVSQISFKATTFYSKDIREIASVIANTNVFFGADSGMMHLASASLTPTVGLFSVTQIEKYQPYGNHSIALNTNALSAEEIISDLANVLIDS